jgi:hypothetical protein
MFGRFLKEAGQALDQPKLYGIADEFKVIGDRWQDVALLFKDKWDRPNPDHVLPETSQVILEIAEMEEAAWNKLGEIVKK